ncbi:plantaricin C family lantibiotic [Bacillus pseudomycoides]|uniref:Plantaricin C family lantibiotic n=1 Tax=Bacillus bingmayongensis TaxID=1150157 RepID=A0ABU5JS51_9BACI|nr:hypothetical protein KOW_04252 [Bacillus cereus VDM006]MDZ5606026.1 plantaricin C family lantibiotic [Bacillus pseudomycoides]
MSEKMYELAGDLSKELEEISIQSINGGSDVDVRGIGISSGNDGGVCTLTWECGKCPTVTCWSWSC